jgi:uncharacterized repeat protein (TIGR01451 family)
MSRAGNDLFAVSNVGSRWAYSLVSRFLVVVFLFALWFVPNAARAAVTATQAIASTTLTASHAATPFTPVIGSSGTAPLTYSISPSLPAGLIFSTTDGQISGTPTVASPTTTYTVTVTDATSATDTATFNLTVTGATPTLAVTVTASPASVTTGSNVTYGISLTVNGATATNVSWSDNLPAGLTLVSLAAPGGWSCATPAVGANGTVSCTTASAAPGTYNFSLVAQVATGTVGSIANTVTASADNATSASNGAAISVQQTTSVTLTSSPNPSAPGQSVTFTARVSSGSGTPTGTMTFKDGATAIGTGVLTAGVATFTISSLANGAHSITASYPGVAGFAASTSSTLTQTVAIPADSIKLRQMQVAVTKVIAQNSGQAISGAIDDAIEDGFGDGGELISPNGSGIRFNFAADPEPPGRANRDNMASDRGTNIFAKDNTGPRGQSGIGIARSSRNSSRVDDAFAAMASSAMPTKAPPATVRAPKDWLLWADVRGSGIDRWGSSSGSSQAQLYGWQVNTLVGLTRRVTPSFLVGVVGGYETFDYTSQDLNGKLKGDGWTVGSYLGWKLTSSIRFDLAVAYSGIGYDGTAGTAHGNFDGHRWMVSSGFTGDYKAYGFTFEPSAKVYALWEHENAYTDSLGTRQGDRDFSTGRASGGVKLIYPYEWSESLALAPYVGLYGDYYFTYDNAADLSSADTSPLASTPLLDGCSARVTGGLAAKLAGGSSIGLEAELGGIGSDVAIWTFRARGNVPF